MKKNLILVGNKPPMREPLGNEIDSFDYVMRINRMNYLGHSGNRIDGLFLEANTEFTKIFKGGDNKKSIKSAGQILMRNCWYEMFSEWREYISERQYNGIEIINERNAISETGFERLTSPVLLLGHLLNSGWAEQYNIWITCLDIENRAIMIDNHSIWQWHKGAGLFEERYLKNKLKSGQIFRLKDE
ncbi:hypothetical protein DBR40_13220 [Pedobacter sp. KBW01]|uniref:hypothetical protein n=1 Tax=Pedobacter sp. KBW01 TaxID=2153364 RepID=UPI000F5B0667|nr:hypothetical protein [Pedobacter sp. KBW01]RQO73764.1 hypothetical protein DBR40_13220 [Pedobacter sp. KBW01]